MSLSGAHNDPLWNINGCSKCSTWDHTTQDDLDEGMFTTRLEKAMRSRNCHRLHAQTTADEAKKLLDRPAEELSKDEHNKLIFLRERLSDKIEDLEEKDETIEELVDDDKLEETIRNSIDEVEALREVLFCIKAYLKAIDEHISPTEAEALKGEVESLARQVRDSEERSRSTPSTPLSGMSSNHNHRPQLRLPPLTPPTFSGNYTLFTAFAELFTASVRDNSQLSDCEKMQYLKSSLQGEALSVVASLPLTGSSFNTAWTMLCERYENKRAISRDHIAAISQFAPIKGDETSRLRNLHQTMDENRMAIIAQGIDPVGTRF